MAFLVYNYTNRFSSLIEYHFDIENQLFKQIQTLRTPSVDNNPITTDIGEGDEVENLEEESKE